MKLRTFTSLLKNIALFSFLSWSVGNLEAAAGKTGQQMYDELLATLTEEEWGETLNDYLMRDSNGETSLVIDFKRLEELRDQLTNQETRRFFNLCYLKLTKRLGDILNPPEADLISPDETQAKGAALSLLADLSDITSDDSFESSFNSSFESSFNASFELGQDSFEATESENNPHNNVEQSPKQKLIKRISSYEKGSILRNIFQQAREDVAFERITKAIASGAIATRRGSREWRR